MTEKTTETTSSLIGDAPKQVSSLVRGEVDLARAEIDENIRRATTAMGLLIAVLVIAITALNVLTAAIVAGLSDAGRDPGWAASAGMVVLAIIAYVFVQKGMNDFKHTSIASNRTAENIRHRVR